VGAAASRFAAAGEGELCLVTRPTRTTSPLEFFSARHLHSYERIRAREREAPFFVRLEMKSPSTSNLTLEIARPTFAKKPARRITSRAREAWITDPQALLAALASAEQAARDAEERAHHERELRPAPPAPIELEPAPSPIVSLPRLREDERIGRPADRDVVVIIRRRRAA
jgi:hypothetical protein